jgi:hypothetical protein
VYSAETKSWQEEGYDALTANCGEDGFVGADRSQVLRQVAGTCWGTNSRERDKSAGREL